MWVSLGPRHSGGGANGGGGAEEESAWYPLHAHARTAVEFHHRRVILGYDRARN